MTVEDWTFEAVEELGRGVRGVRLREIQRHIDEHHFEELAADTIEAALTRLVESGRLEPTQDGWRASRKTSKEDALKKLFGGG